MIVRPGRLLRRASVAVAGDPYYSSVSLLAVNNNGANGSTTFTDQSSVGHTITAVGNAAWSTTRAPTGLTSSLAIDGVGDRLSVPDHTSLDLGSGDFTIEFTMWCNSVTGLISPLGKRTSGSPERWAMFLINDGDFTWRAAGLPLVSNWDIANFAGIGTVTTNTWYHVALCRSGNTWTPYLSGVAGSGVVTSSKALSNDAVPLTIGGDGGGSGWDLNGNIGAVRITKGVARYTANFTPPSLPYLSS